VDLSGALPSPNLSLFRNQRRNLALAIMLLVALTRKAREPLRILVILTAFIQLLDAGLDGMEQRWTLVPGVLLFAIAFFVVAAWLSRYSPGRT